MEIMVVQTISCNSYRKHENQLNITWLVYCMKCSLIYAFVESSYEILTADVKTA